MIVRSPHDTNLRLPGNALRLQPLLVIAEIASGQITIAMASDGKEGWSGTLIVETVSCACVSGGAASAVGVCVD